MQTTGSNPGYELTAAILEAADALLRASQKLFRPHGLSAAQFNVLNVVAQAESGMSQRELSDLLVVDKSNITGLLDRMEKAGWVRRDDNPDDRRVYLVSLTAGGRKLRERVNPLYLSSVAEVTRGLSGRRIRECAELLRRLACSSEQWAGAPSEGKRAQGVRGQS